MSCLFCERVDETTFYSLNEIRTYHSMTPIREFFEKIVGSPIKLNESNQVFCSSCYNNMNEVDEMEMKIKEITDDMKSRFKKRKNIKEQIIISSADHTEIYSVITVDDGPDYFEYNEDNDMTLNSPKSKKDYSIITDNSEDDKKDLVDPSDKTINSAIKNEKIHFTDQNDLKNILNLKIKSEDVSVKWEDNVSHSDVGVLYDMMDEKNCEILVETKSSSKKSPTTCSKCDLSFPTKQELKSHLASHAQDKPYICEICGKVYRHKSALNIHVGMHNGIIPFKCLHCDKTFTQKGAMIRHNKIHTGEKPYQCEECGKCFTHHTSFTIHKISHTGEKSYKCNVCGLMLMSTSHLKRHMRVHTGEKRYTCPTCGKRFAEKYNLVSHSKLHSNEITASQKRKFRCEICHLFFYKRLHLEEHVTKIHAMADDYGYS